MDKGLRGLMCWKDDDDAEILQAQSSAVSSPCECLFRQVMFVCSSPYL